MSKLINCETCGKEIAKKAKTCPNCGAKRSTRGFFKTTLIVLIVFMGLALLGGIMDAGGMPTCDSTTGISLAKQAMNEKLLHNGINMQIDALSRGSNASVANDEVIDILNAGEVSYDEQVQIRVCKGTAETTLSGNVSVGYSFRALNDGTIDVHVSANGR